MFKTVLILALILRLCLTNELDYQEPCQILFTYGYGYRQFFHLPPSSFLPNGSIHLEFAVKASSDAHILLTPKSNPADSDPVYEIVLGAGKNSFSDIRRLRKSGSRSSVMTKNILSATHMKKFWLKTGMFKNGTDTYLTIMVGEEKEEIPFLQWSDIAPLMINYMSFCTWTGVAGTWAYDCKGANPVIRKKTKLMTLKEELFDKYDPFLLPYADNDTVDISTSITITHIEMDTHTSIIKVTASFRLNWFDSRLQWNPTNYRNISLLKITEREIWQPSLVLYNGVNSAKEFLNQGILTVSNTGDVMWASTCMAEVRCPTDYSKWPQDSHTCVLDIGVHDDHEAITLTSPKMSAFYTNLYEWKLIGLGSKSGKSPLPWQTMLNEDLAGYNATYMMTVKMVIARQSNTATNLLYIPILAVMVISLIPLLLSLKGSERIFLQFIVLTIFVLELLSIDLIAPSSTSPPAILTLCGNLILITSLSITVTLWLNSKETSTPDEPPPAFICSLLEMPILSPLLTFRITKHTRMEEFDDKDSDEPKGQITNYWTVLISLIDRFLFTTVLFSYALVLFL